jgi:adenylate cyclase, class 2
MQYTEVEKKFRIDDPDTLRARLREMGARSSGTFHQVDQYYNPPHRDFLQPPIVSEWLRLRDQDGTTSINYKRWLPLGAERQTHCDEFESALADGEAVRRLLEALDFKEMVTVTKTREEFLLDDRLTIALDSVVGLGSFVEFEYRGHADSVERAHEELSQLIDELGVELGERDRRGYPYQLLGRQR